MKYALSDQTYIQTYVKTYVTETCNTYLHMNIYVFLVKLASLKL